MNSYWLIVLLIIGIAHCQAGQVYKYKDSNGNWIFSDKSPIKAQNFETLKYTNIKKPTSKIKLYYDKGTKGFSLYAKNDFFAPIEVSITHPTTKALIRKVIPARGDILLLHNDKKIESLPYRWVLGDPYSVADDNYQYQPPFDSPKEHIVTQAFNGKFSHTNNYNKYAVDIAMNVGTYLTAVRSGTVVWVKDDYHMSGTTRYFLDKANGIKILHDDGTFSLYAHILMDTAVVKEGDKVTTGDRLARSGSSGFSTGPHLHFSIIKNIGLRNISIPFKFVDSKGEVFTPKRAMMIVGAIK